MLLTITTTHQPATDLGYLLQKHPERCQTFKLPFGQAHVFYPVAEADRRTVALALDMDAIELNRRRTRGFGWDQYVNDRPYVASSFTSVAIARVFGSAMKGQCPERGELAESAIPLSASASVVRCEEGASLIRSLFEPLGYAIQVSGHPLDSELSEWGESPYYSITLEGDQRLCDLLTHLYVLLPVLDDEKHYFVDENEIEKLMARGEAWLPDHPERETIVERYLKHQRGLTVQAIDQIGGDEQVSRNLAESEEDVAEEGLKLHQHRRAAVLSEVAKSGATEVVDLGCGDGVFVKAMLEQGISRIVGMDVSHRSLERAARRLDLERMPPTQRNRLNLIQGSLTYKDDRLQGFEAALLVEVIEHIDPPRIPAFERVVFEFARPNTVILTTPNADYNSQWPSLNAGAFRHEDHRFEWGREVFQSWADSVSDRFGYDVRYESIGEAEPEVGSPTQMAVFTLSEGTDGEA